MAKDAETENEQVDRRSPEDPDRQPHTPKARDDTTKPAFEYRDWALI